jgi:hypothetical protein
LAFARNFANASLREYLFSAGRGGIAIRLSKAAMAAWSIASVITSLCVIKFLLMYSATRTICKVAQWQDGRNMPRAFIYRVLSSYYNE